MRRKATAIASWAAGLALAAGAWAATPAFPVFTVTLENGAGGNIPMALEFRPRDGRYDKAVWGRCPEYAFGQHAGEVVSQAVKNDEVALAVRLTIASDTRAPGGPAKYEIALKRVNDAFSGTFSGVFIDAPVKGAAAGALSADPVAEVPGFTPPKPGEHPRMIFRREDLPELRRRMSTPQGEAIMAMLKVRSPLRKPDQLDDRRSSWLGANWGALHHLAGETNAAEEAKSVIMMETVSKPMPIDRTDIQHAPRLLGLALAYDLCYDAWDETFRRLMAQYIGFTMVNLYAGVHDGLPMPEPAIDPDPLKHRNAVRMACIGCAALAILNDPGLDEKLAKAADRLARVAEREVVIYLREGITQTGVCLEGDLYKSLALANGVLQFMQASKTVAGRDLSGANPFLLAGQIVSAREIGAGGFRFGISSISIQASGRWPMGLGSLPQAFLPAMKWCFDRDCGLEGLKHFDCAYPFQAAYALANYPFGIEARPPAEALPLTMADGLHGQFVFRNRWVDAGDILTAYLPRYRSIPGLEPRTAPPAGTLRISGMGQDWLNGTVGFRCRNTLLGAEPLYAGAAGAKQACVGARLDRMYYQQARPASKEKAAAPAIRVAGFADGFTDAGIRCTRHFGIDYSGVSGAPCLAVIVDTAENADKEWWELGGLMKPAFTGNSFMVGDPQGTNFQGRLVLPKTGLNPQGRIRGANRYCLVMTLQSGTPPEASVEGEGAALKIRVGGQTVSLKDGRLAFEK